MSKRVAVIGLGYIGLPTAAILASYHQKVVGVDINPKHVEAVNRGEIPFIEPDLAALVAGAVSQGELSAQADTPPADIYIIAVPTPFRDGHHADLSYIEAAIDGIIPHLQGGELIILESTSPPGTTQHLADRVTAARPELTTNDPDAEDNIDVAYCPERVLPGRVMIELIENDRIVGGLTDRASARARDLYTTFCQGDIFRTDAVTAEMAKLTENSFRDVNIAFANELSMIAERLDIDVFALIELANKHPRVNILQPGPGVGGHCIAVDPWFIVSAAPEESQLIRTARQVNDSKPEYVINQVLESVEAEQAEAVAVLGLAFKPDIDDLRGSPALHIAQELAKRLPRTRLLVVEPNVQSLPPSLTGHEHVTLVDGYAEAVKDADLTVLLVDHREFRTLATEVPDGHRVIDTRGVTRGLGAAT